MKFQTNILKIALILLLVNACQKPTTDSVLYLVTNDTFIDDIVVEGTIQAQNSSTVTCPQRLDGIIIFLIDDGLFVHKGDTVCIIENREAENYLENLYTRVENSKVQYAKSKADLDMQYALLQAQVKSNEAQTSITNLDTVQLQYLSIQQQKIKELELKKSAIEKAKFEHKLELLEKINSSELRKLKLQIEQDENQAEHIKSIIDQMIMLAPQDGMVVRAKSWQTGNTLQEGDEIWNGVPVVEIPDKSSVKVLIKAAESDYKRIAEKDSIVFTFNAMPGNLAYGEVLNKAPVGKQIKRNSKVKYFEITASVDSFLVVPDLGLSANCRIILSVVPDTIVIPQLAVFDDDSIKVVYVKQNNNYIKREVLLGSSSAKSAVISAGLKIGETVSFQQPKNSRVKGSEYLPDSLRVKEDPKLDSVNMNKTIKASELPSGVVIMN